MRTVCGFFQCFSILGFSLLCGCGFHGENEPFHGGTGDPQRVIATAPSIAETLFALELGDRVVGVSRFCTYPEQVRSIPKIGGYLDRDDEMILQLQPDLVIELEENLESCRRFRGLGIEVLPVNHRTLEGVLESFLLIGRRFGEEGLENAEKLHREVSGRLQRIEERTRSRKPVRTLICVDRERGRGDLLSLCVAGNSAYYRRTLEIAGGINVAGEIPHPFPVVSLEDVLLMNPEVIVDLCTVPIPGDPAQGREDWNRLGESVDAVRNGRVFVFTEDYTNVPGPRIPQFVERFAEALHPRGIEPEIFP